MKDGLTQVKELKDKIHEQYIEIQELNKARKTDIEYNKYLQKEIIRLNNIIEEAIEYIDNNLQYRTTKWSRHYLLKILKGSDKE